jgi:nicotinate phosphoribosyltransferase
MLQSLYKSSLVLLTDLYQLTMAYAYWKSEKHNTESVFHLFYRKEPFKGGYTIACGLETVIDYLRNLKFDASDIDYLRSLNGHDGQPLFEEGFYDYLRSMQFSCSVDAVPEGTPMFINEPLVRVQGPLLQAQLIETFLLNTINYQTLVATKASRICHAAKGAPVLEFGLRRAQGIDGSLSATRAAYIGGCSATSNVLGGKLLGIPVSGTHAHSWIMSFDNEMEAFEKYAEVMDNNCTLLVDTYNTRQGIINALEIGKAMKANGKKLLGIRIDSGDLAYFSQMARDLLDHAGLNDVQIVASNDLDEYILKSLCDQKAKIDIAGVGTKLVTAYDQPALGGVYKLSALKNKYGVWVNKLKLSEQSIKINIPGIQQVRRYFKNGEMSADMLFDVNFGVPASPTIVDSADSTRRKHIDEKDYDYQDLLIPIFDNGRLVYDKPALDEIRTFAAGELRKLHPSIRRFVNPHTYVAGLEHQLFEERIRLILQQRKLIR